MPPSFYHYLPVSMGKEQGWGSCRRRWLVAAILAVLIGAVLLTLTIYFGVTSYSEASNDRLRAQAECRNTTHLLQRQLTRAQDSLLQAETQADSCNRTVVRLETTPSNASSDSGPSKSPTTLKDSPLRMGKSQETLELSTALQSGASVSPFQDLVGLQISWRMLELVTWWTSIWLHGVVTQL